MCVIFWPVSFPPGSPVAVGTRPISNILAAHGLSWYPFRVCSIYEALPGEEAESAFMPLHCYQARRQTTGKEFPVKEIISGSQTRVCLCCWIFHKQLPLFLCIVRYNSITFISILSRTNDLPGRGEKAKSI